MTAKDIYDQLIKGASEEEQQLNKVSILLLCVIAHISAEKDKVNPGEINAVTFSEVMDTLKEVHLDKLLEPNLGVEKELLTNILVAVSMLGVLDLVACEDPKEGIYPTIKGMLTAASIFVDQRPMKVSAVYEVADRFNVKSNQALLNN